MPVYHPCVSITRRFRLQTRSGSSFSPWAMGNTQRTINPLCPADFDFGQLVLNAVAVERELDDDDTEGYSLDPVTTPFSSPTPLSPIPDELLERELDDEVTEAYSLDPVTTPFSSPTPLSPIPDELLQSPCRSAVLGTTCPASPEPLPHGTMSVPLLTSGVKAKPPPRGAPKYPRGSAEDALRKKRGKAKRAMQRLKEKRAAPLGHYAIKPAVIKHHVRPAAAIATKLNTTKLQHTKNGWTGARDKGGFKRIFTLDEMVGENSFGFRLERWDGRYVGQLTPYYACSNLG
jgi:hypothetical protein